VHRPFFTVLAACVLTAMTPSSFNDVDRYLDQFIDRTVSPRDDFFHYAVGKWLREHPIPKSERSWGVADVIQEETYQRLLGLSTAAASVKGTASSDQQKIGDFWYAAMDTATIAAQGFAWLDSELARITAERTKMLTARGIAPLQEGDQSQAQLSAQDANVRALEKAILAQRSNLVAGKANLARLQELQGYRLVKAPFDGVITLRNVDVGALVSTGSTLLYRLAQIGTLRTYINVPQSQVNSVRAGQAAALTVSHFPGRSFRGIVARTANALDPATRTMLVEVDVPNADGALFPGTYAEVDLSGAQVNAPLVVPAAALVFRTDGAQVAVVQADQTVHLQKITVGRDYGDRVEILQGLTEGATILAAPGDAAREGARIVPVTRDARP